MTSSWITEGRNWVLATAAQANHWPWWALADIILLNLFSFSWTLEKACVDWDIAWSFTFFFSHFGRNIYLTQQPCRCFILSHYSALRCQGLKQSKAVRHLRTCLWCPHSMCRHLLQLPWEGGVWTVMQWKPPLKTAIFVPENDWISQRSTWNYLIGISVNCSVAL